MGVPSSCPTGTCQALNTASDPLAAAEELETSPTTGRCPTAPAEPLSHRPSFSSLPSCSHLWTRVSPGSVARLGLSPQGSRGPVPAPARTLLLAQG